MNLEAPHSPFYYSSTFNLDLYSRQYRDELFKKQKYLELVKEKNLLGDINSYKKIICFPHINLNHLCISCSSKPEDKVIKGAASQRIRHKELTIVYYLPKE